MLLLGLLGACSTLRTDFVKQPSTAIAPVTDTSATRYVQRELAAHPDQSGFRLLVSNQNALMSRIVLADQARHSIDLQYYIFANDATGRLLAQRLLAAADRGVRVRILLDDIDIANEDALLDALDAHPNIQVRLFNPFRYRQRSMLSKVGQFLLEGARLNRRMHNKSFIVDGMQAIIGGRNIGDAYFDVGDDVHFRDLDALAIGPVVPEIAASFDAYWNSDAAFPVRAYSGDAATSRNLANARAELGRDARAFSETDYAQALSYELPDGPSADQRGGWFWGSARLAADDPTKVDPDEDRRATHIDHQIKDVIEAAQTQALLVSPYFIPGDKGATLLETLASRGVDIKVLTNSLAATDEPEVHRRLFAIPSPPAQCWHPTVRIPSDRRQQERPRVGPVVRRQPACEDDGGRPSPRIHRFDELRSALALPQYGDGHHRRLSRARRGGRTIFRACDHAAKLVQCLAGTGERRAVGARDALDRDGRWQVRGVRPRSRRIRVETCRGRPAAGTTDRRVVVAVRDERAGTAAPDHARPNGNASCADRGVCNG